MEYTLPGEWVEHGARFGRDGLLYLTPWRRGFTVHELQALFFESQRTRALERDNSRLARELEAAKEAEARAGERAAWYRRQLVLESRLGAMLERIA